MKMVGCLESARPTPPPPPSNQNPPHTNNQLAPFCQDFDITPIRLFRPSTHLADAAVIFLLVPAAAPRPLLGALASAPAPAHAHAPLYPPPYISFVMSACAVKHF